MVINQVLTHFFIVFISISYGYLVNFSANEAPTIPPKAQWDVLTGIPTIEATKIAVEAPISLENVYIGS